jgi:hypothetical protein
MFNLISKIGHKRDDYGVSDLLDEVCRTCASLSAEDREEINAMSRRLRQHRTNEHTPRQTPDNSYHGMNNSRKGFGRDLPRKEDFLRGFANLLHSPGKQSHEGILISPPTSPNGPIVCDSGTALLRGFASPGSTQHLPVEVHVDACVFPMEQKV